MAEIDTPIASRQEVARRNVEAILNATEALLRRRQQPNFSAVATESGLSRPTVYSHFASRAQLIEALVERSVRQAITAIQLADLERGEAPEALRRLVTVGWEHLERYEEIALVAAGELSGDSMRRAHSGAREVIGKLIERGRRQGSFRDDMSTEWLITCMLALVHAAAEEVHSKRMELSTALQLLLGTIDGIFAPD